MEIAHNLDMVSLTLIISIGLICAAALFFWSEKHYELVIIMILLSPWVHFLFATNIPVDPEDVLNATGSIEPSTYIRTSIVLFAGSIGVYKFLQSQSLDEGKIPVYFYVFGAFLLYALLSTSYSIDRRYTFIRTAEFIAFFCFLMGFFFWLKDSAHMDKTLDIFFLIIALGTIINASILVLFPDRAWWWQAPERLQGFMAHPNTLGSFCMISYPVLLWEYNRQGTTLRLFILALLSMLLVMHILSGSRTSLAASFIGFAAWHIILKKKLTFILITAIVLFGGLFLVQSRLPGFERAESNSITHLTGRTQFWLGSLELAAEKPILGYGYAVEGKIWEDPRFQSNKSQLWMGSAKSSIHNGYLSVAIGLGFVGLIIWMTIIIPPFWHVLYLPTDYYKALFLVVLIQLLLTNVFESAISSSRSLESIMFWMFWIIAIKYLRFMTPEAQ
ncbi:MAG TPA: O-antigen ligase family protein [Deltaproteobacteria bacterium]|nr:O-antigen ligase family protein [Deltaproteobacteria bacterium]HPR52041.1 O-antigen ligase family protein [Deltaproteobacteria bacterium]